MKEIPVKLIRKNNIAAYWFLATAILSVLLLAFLTFVFVLIFGSINALVTSLGGKSEDNFNAANLWQLYLAFFVCAAVVISQFTAFYLIKTRSQYGRTVGIVSFILTVLISTPLSLLVIYPFAFLVSNDGKYIYQKFYKNN